MAIEYVCLSISGHAKNNTHTHTQSVAAAATARPVMSVAYRLITAYADMLFSCVCVCKRHAFKRIDPDRRSYACTTGIVYVLLHASDPAWLARAGYR